MRARTTAAKGPVRLGWPVAGLVLLLLLLLLSLGISTAVGLKRNRPVVRDPVLIVENRGTSEVTAITIHETPRGAAAASPVTSRIARLGPGGRVRFGCGRDPRFVVEYTVDGVERSYASDTALGVGEVWVISIGGDGRPTERYGRAEEGVDRSEDGVMPAPIGPRSE